MEYYKQYNIHEAKTHLSALIDKAVHGEPFIIAKAGKPLVKVSPFIPNKNENLRIGFMSGQINIPSDFNEMGSMEITNMFEGGHN